VTKIVFSIPRNAVVGGVALVVVSGALVAAEDRPARLSVDDIKKSLEAPGAHDPFVPAAPVGIDPEAVKKGIPQNDPLTKAKVELGKQLYFDARLSKDNTVSCASCHRPDHGWGDPRAFSAGVGGALGGRHSPTVLNRGLGTIQFWDGRAKTLEDQALGPIANPVEMNLPLAEALTRLNAIEGYRLQFEKVFGGPASEERVAKAIAAFERTVLGGSSRVDLDEDAERYAKVDLDDADADLKARATKAIEAAKKAPLTDSERRGKAIFYGKANCSLCHAGNNYADDDFYNLGVGANAKTPDAGRMDATKKEDDWGKFKTPTLRGTLVRAPYMHDGSEPTLEAVVEYYDKGGTPNKNLSPRIKKLGLSKDEKADLVAFLKALSGEVPVVEAPRLP
jgi:cytochrome c peroxidase